MSRVTKFILYAFYFVAVIALGAVIVMSFTSKHSTPEPKTLATQQSHMPGKHTTANKPVTQSKPAKAAPGTTTLQNTGPGNYLYLFLGATLTGAYFYRRRLLSRADNS